MEQRNKKWRETKRQALYRRQLKLHAARGWDSIGGSSIRDWNMLRNEKCLKVYKSVRRPCSCCICKHERYSRLAWKRMTSRFIREDYDVSDITSRNENT